MGRSQNFALPAAQVREPDALRRRGEAIASALGLVLLLPLLGLVALLVRSTSHGPVLHRDLAVGRRGEAVELLSFRTLVDGGGTETHARLRAVVGATSAYTPVGRVLCRSRLDRLPRLLNVVRGETSLFGR